MVKLGIIQATSYQSNEQAIGALKKRLESLGKKEADIVCLPEQWLKNNQILDFDLEFAEFKKIAKEYSMTIIPGAFYAKKRRKSIICSPVIGQSGEIIGIQEKIHPFGYEKGLVKPGSQTKIFKSKCKFGIVICYDMVFPDVSKSFVKKGAEVLFSPSRIVKRGIYPWQLYVQVRSLENRIPILAANVESHRFGGNSIIVDLIEKDEVMIPKIIANLKSEGGKLKEFNLKKYQKNRKIRYSDSKKFT